MSSEKFRGFEDKYRGFEDKVSGDMHKASLSAHVNLEDRSQRIRLRHSALPSMIPQGAMIEIEPIVFHKIRFGEVVYCKLGNELALRRFVRLELINDNDVLVLVREGGKRVERVPANALVGRVSACEFNGRAVQLRHSGNLMDWLTDFATTTPLHKIKNLLSNWKGDRVIKVVDPNAKKKAAARKAPAPK